MLSRLQQSEVRLFRIRYPNVEKRASFYLKNLYSFGGKDNENERTFILLIRSYS